jgi:hypothetical protein
MRKKFRSVVAIAAAAAALVVAGMWVPAASAANEKTLVFVTQPQDSEAGATIHAADLNQASGLVQVKLVDANGNIITNSNSKVTFALRAGTGFANGSLSVTPQSLAGDGIAEFGEGTLSIGTPNEPFFTDYSLVPSTTGGGPKITGDPSAPFDIFGDGESCVGESCDAQTPNGTGTETYAVTTTGTLGASKLAASALPGFSCAVFGQKEIYPGSVFVHVTTETDNNDVFAPVLVQSHITKRDMKASTNNGQSHVDWCVGLKTAAAWIANGAAFEQQDTNQDGTLDLYVGLAPPCPQSNPSSKAPCLVSQTGDGSGGSIVTGWVPGGDPPRRP